MIAISQELSDIISWIIGYGPTMLRLGLLVSTFYFAWRHRPLKSIISLAACVSTFVLGW